MSIPVRYGWTLCWTFTYTGRGSWTAPYLTRKYRVPLLQPSTELDTPGTSPPPGWTPLLNAPGLAGESYSHAGSGRETGLVDALALGQSTPITDSRDCSPASALTGLEEAVRADLAEGTLGRRYLWRTGTG